MHAHTRLARLLKKVWYCHKIKYDYFTLSVKWCKFHFYRVFITRLKTMAFPCIRYCSRQWKSWLQFLLFFYNALPADPKDSITVKHTMFMHVYYLTLNFIISYIYDYYTRISLNLISLKNRIAELIYRSYWKSFKFKQVYLNLSLRDRNLTSNTICVIVYSYTVYTHWFTVYIK